MSGEELVRHWKDPDSRDWPDEDHPAGQMYLHMRALVGGYDAVAFGVLDPTQPPDSIDNLCSLSITAG